MVVTRRTHVSVLLAAFMACLFVLTPAPDTAYGFTTIRNDCVAFYVPAPEELSDCQRAINSIVDAGGTSCQLCHVNPNGGQPWNIYGWDLRQNGLNFAAVDTIDSDGSGFTNGQEIGFDPTGPYGAQPGWTVEAPPFPPGNQECNDPPTEEGEPNCLPTTQVPTVAGPLDPTDVVAVCGDSIIEGDEDCDDGNTNDGDCCSANCTFEPADSPCPDGEFCNGEETCDGAGSCQAGPPVDCSDGVDCTDDSCDEINDTCMNDPNDANCTDDGLFCTGEEFCDGELGCINTGDPCPAGTVCNDGTDTCDVQTACGNGVLEGEEQCDDGNTADGDCCSANCTFEPFASPCPDGVFCNGWEQCDGEGNCSLAVSSCPPFIEGCVERGAICDEENDTCLDSPNDDECDDGEFCNGEETCDVDTGACLSGTPVDCSDGVGCTDDSCDEINDTCMNDPNDANCPDDGMFCNGTEFCDIEADCSSSGDPCPAGEACNEDQDICEVQEACGNGVLEGEEQCDDGNIMDGDCCSANCTFEPAGSPCPDGEFCNGEETCDGAGTCMAGTDVDCSDGVDCTVDSCDENNDECVNTENDNNCLDDGLYCTGQEVCDLLFGCMSTGDPCVEGQSCNEENDTCESLDGKVTICHIPPGNPDKMKSLTIGADSVPDHLGHGDILGPCPNNDV